MILERLRGEGRRGRNSGETWWDRSLLPAAAESVLLPAAGLALGLWLRPGDPFFLAAQFPWIWLVPLFVALRHGSTGALIASLTVVAGWSLFASGTPAPMEYPKGYLLGGFIAAFICGEFRDLWHAEVRRERKAKEHLELRLNEFAGAHRILALSHERLLADFIGHPPTLRDALEEIPRPRPGRLDQESAQALLVFLARFFQLETAAFHIMDEGGLRAAPLAALGPARRLDGTETLVAACFRTGSLCHALEEGGAPGPYLFAAPLTAGAGPVLAVLVAERMPFFAFQEENLRNLFAVLGCYADLLSVSTLAAPVIARIPDCPEEFAAGYLRLHRLHASARVACVLAARVLPGGGADRNGTVAASHGGNLNPGSAGRGADLFWRRELPDGKAALIALLPFCGEEEGRIVLARLGEGAGQTGAQSGGDRVASLTRDEPVRELETFLRGLA